MPQCDEANKCGGALRAQLLSGDDRRGTKREKCLFIKLHKAREETKKVHLQSFEPRGIFRTFYYHLACDGGRASVEEGTRLKWKTLGLLFVASVGSIT